MSKILVLDDRQFQELKRIFESAINNFLIPQDMEITSFYDSIQRAFEDAEKDNRSVLEWHPMSEKPQAKKIFIKLKTGKVAIADAWIPQFPSADSLGWEIDYFDIDDVIEWAYLPE